MTIRIIQVGLGEWGRDWAVNVLPIAEGIEVVAAVDHDPAAIEKARAAGLLDGIDVYDTLDAALRETDAEAVLATVAIAAHGSVMLTALRAGRHVLVEKPFAATLDEARRAVDAARTRGLTLAVAQNYRYDSAVALVSRLVRERALGAVHGLVVDFRRSYPFDDAASRNPELDHSILVQIAIHHFDMMRAVLDRDPVRVYCHTWRPPPSGSTAPQATAAIVEFEGGAVATFRASMVSTGEETPWSGLWRIECADGDIVLRGPDYPVVEDGTFRYDHRDPGYLELRPRGEAPQRLELPAMLFPRVVLLEAFVSAIENGTDLPISGHNNLPSMALMIAAMESAERGEAVPVTPT
jgi:predicted dehydrogenase